ncbi:MAG: hypothetical protein HXY45_18760 [Syntrophaceae bacterium]|nr:hypothetical protein [Syntrophaceae bacterium]
MLERKAKDPAHRRSAPIENPSVEREFLEREGNRFAATARGLIYCPRAGGAKKHPCPDCYFCQFCSDSRCGLCRRGPQPRKNGKEPSD